LATGAGGSSRVVIRGNGSLSGDNQPLYVINGMPIDNSTPGVAQLQVVVDTTLTVVMVLVVSTLTILKVSQS
jgi:hypothetical protein